MSMRVMVTGAAGLLGQHTARQLLDRGDQVVAVDNLSRYRLFGESRPQAIPDVLYRDGCKFIEASFFDPEVLAVLGNMGAVVHAAANTSHPLSVLNPSIDFTINAVGTFRLLEAIRVLPKKPRLVNISSAKIYNMALPTVERETRLEAAPRRLIREDHPVGGFITPFGVSKLAADQYVHNYSRLYGLDACSVRPGCFSGRGSLAVQLQNWAPMLVRAMVRGETFEVFGYAGKQVRDLLHVDDLARLVLACIDRAEPWCGEAMNACGGPGRDISILEAVALIERISGKRGELYFAPARVADWAWFIGANSCAEVALGWHPEIALEVILRELCEEALS